jgi:pilus assembly protein CpaE
VEKEGLSKVPASNHIRALLICPSLELSQKLAIAGARRKFFEIAGEMHDYGSAASVETKVRQVRPEVVLIDVASNLEAAGTLIRHLADTLPSIPVVGLHTSADSGAILQTLRAGATEFLYAPFETSVQEAAVARVRKLTDPTGGIERARGKVVGFSSAKPGSGATTLAVQTARALKKAERRRVLVIDLNFAGAAAAFALGIVPRANIEPLLEPGFRIDHGTWSQCIESADGLDVLAAPDLPLSQPVDRSQVAHVLDHARGLYDWVVLDLPCVFDRLTLGCMSEADRSYMVSTSDLASLHLTRRAVKMLRQFGFDSTRFGVLLNRMDQRSELSDIELKKLFDCDIDRGLPGDPSHVDMSLLKGAPLNGGTLGKAIDGLAAQLTRALSNGTESGRARMNEARPALSRA